MHTQKLGPPLVATNRVTPTPEEGNSFRDALVRWESGLHGTATGGKGRALPDHLWKAGWLVGDLLLWCAAAATSLALLHFLSHGSVFQVPSVVLFPLGISLLASWISGGYDRDSDFASLRFASEYLIAGIIAAFVGPALVALFSTYGQGVQTSRFFLFATPFFATITWLAVRRVLSHSTAHATTAQRIIVLGSQQEAQRLAHALSLTDKPHRVVNILAEDAVKGRLEDELRQQHDTDLPSHHTHDTVVVSPSATKTLATLGPLLVSLHASTVPVYTWSAFWSQRIKTLDWGTDSPEWFFEKNYRLCQNSIYPHLKRLGDVMVAGLGLVLSLPILLATAVAIRLDSPGPVIFKQKRVGLRAKEFTIYKFRTMTLGAEKTGQTTTKNDARITKLGNLLRKFRIDEIPQLWNVLKGEMSIVGPRPEWTTCVENYEDKLPHYHLRHLVKPGITGWAQVNYPYGEGLEDAKNKLSFDLYYVAHSAFMLDCSIMLKTIYVLAGRVGGQ